MYCKSHRELYIFPLLEKGYIHFLLLNSFFFNKVPGFWPCYHADLIWPVGPFKSAPIFYIFLVTRITPDLSSPDGAKLPSPNGGEVILSTFVRPNPSLLPHFSPYLVCSLSCNYRKKQKYKLS